MYVTNKASSYALVSLAVPAAALVIAFLLGANVFGLVIGAVILFSIFPCIISGIYMWATGSGHRWMNGPDWTKMSENTRIQGARVMGLILVVASFFMIIGCAVLFFRLGRIENFAAGMSVFLFCTIGCVAVCIIGVVKVSKKSFEEKWKYRTSKDPSRSAVCAAVAVSVLMLVPLCLSISEMGSDENIVVTLDDDDFSVTGPWFEHTFRYSEVEVLYLDEDFEKGSRRAGYGTSAIQSGEFRNSQFGDYELASYAKVRPCIVITVDGEYYAFNQSSVDETAELYEKLRDKIPA